MRSNFNYGIGALITVIISIGGAAIAYGGKFLLFNVFNLPAWILGPLGVYTLIFALISNEVFYYLAWSIVFLLFAVVSALYWMVNVIVIIGILLISLASLSLFAYLRNQKSTPKAR